MMYTRIQRISSRKARRIAVEASRLHQKHPFGTTRDAILNCIRHLGYVQIDTISVINRAHHHVLWTRLPSYQAAQLFSLLEEERQVFEYWSHAAAFLPVEDYRFSLPMKQYFLMQKDRWPKPDPILKQEVFNRIRAEGPLMARDFSESKRRGDGWWSWKPAKLALERLFLEGALMVSARQGFQKVYDTVERVLPDHVDQTEPDEDEMADHLINRALQVHGLARTSEITYLRRNVRPAVERRLVQRTEVGDIVPVQIRGQEHDIYYAKASTLNRTFRLGRELRFISPFDHLTIQRDRLKLIFGFDYQIECYVPASRRKYGYFVLPMLYGDQFVGRADFKADRKTRTLHLWKVVYESGWEDKLDAEIWKQALHSFMEFHGSRRLQVHDIIPEKGMPAIEQAGATLHF